MDRFEIRKREERKRSEIGRNLEHGRGETDLGFREGFEDISRRGNYINTTRGRGRLDGFGQVAPGLQKSLSADEVLKECGRDMCRLKAGIMQVRKDESVTYYEMYRVQTTVNHVLADKLDHLHRKLKAVTLTPCARCGLVPASQGVEKNKQVPEPGAHGRGAVDGGNKKAERNVRETETTSSLRGILRRRTPRSPTAERTVSFTEEPSASRKSLPETPHSCGPFDASTPNQSPEGYRIPKLRKPNSVEGNGRDQSRSVGIPRLWREPASICHSETECEGSPRPDDTESDSGLEDPRSARARARRAGLARMANFTVNQKGEPVAEKTGEELNNSRLMSLSLQGSRRRVMQPASSGIISATLARRQEAGQGVTSESDDSDKVSVTSVGNAQRNRSLYTGIPTVIPHVRQQPEPIGKQLENRRTSRRANPYNTQGNLILLSGKSESREQSPELRFWNSVAKGNAGRIYPPGLEE